MQFVHLHLHSHYSLLDGLSKIGEIVRRAKGQRAPAVAITDHGSMYGAIDFYLSCQQAGIKPIIGLEAYVTADLNLPPTVSNERAYNHLTLLAKDFSGYQSLMQLTTAAHLQGWRYRPRVDHALLREHRQGLICLSGCLKGEIPQAILAGQLERARTLINHYREIFGDDFYLEVQSHPHLPEQLKVNQALFNLSEELKVPLVATCDSHYVEPGDAEAQDILLCIQTNARLSDPNRFSMRGESYFMKSPEEVGEFFRAQPAAVENTLAIAAKVDLKIPLGRWVLPNFAVPAGETIESFFRQQVELGMKRRFSHPSPELVARRGFEVAVIKKMGYESYFLIVADYVNWAKEQGIVVGPGRGSVAGSLVAYLLGITDINPLQHGLLFERFLNPDRVSMPDIDVDFADDRRDEVIQYIIEKYGRMNVAQIATFGTMASRAVVRDVGRALGMAYSEVDRVAKLVPPPFQGRNALLRDALRETPELKAEYETQAEVRRLLDVAMRLEGTVRHLSTHAAGVVIADRQLTAYTPLQHAPKTPSLLVTQYHMGALEQVGLIKMDLLGLTNLTTIKNTLRILRKTREIDLKVEDVPLDDLKSYRLLARGQTVGVFQFDGEGIQRHLKELQPSRFEDLIAMVALYRPGPMQLIPDFIARKHSRKKATYLLPQLEPILEETYGIAIYQEQVLKIAQEVCGFTLAEADVLRRAIGKKVRYLLIEQRHKFIEGAARKGVERRIAEQLFDFIEPFASYGFNKSHAAAYALISYWTAYLKANFPNEFMAALLTADKADLDKLAKDIFEAESLKIKVLPPSVNESFTDFAVVKESGYIRFGLNAIKNVGFKVSELIVGERSANGPFNDLADFLRRVPREVLNRKTLESLIKAGALDDFGERGSLLNALERMVELVSRSAPKVAEGQLMMFDELPPAASRPFELPPAEPVGESTRLAWEKELLGTYVSHHPLRDLAKLLLGQVVKIADLTTEDENKRVRLLGILTRLQEVRTKTNERMLFARLEDLTGSLEAIIFPKTMKQFASLLRQGQPLLIEGRVNVKERVVEEGGRLSVQSDAKVVVERIAEVNARSEQKFLVALPRGFTRGALESLKALLKQHPGEVPVNLKIFTSSGWQEITSSLRVSPSLELEEKIQSLVR